MNTAIQIEIITSLPSQPDMRSASEVLREQLELEIDLAMHVAMRKVYGTYHGCPHTVRVHPFKVNT